MAERPIISPDQVIGAAIDALVARRPAALSHINAQRGRYWTILQAWRAQAAQNIQRIFDEMMCSRLATAEGRPLADLSSSEFFADLPTVSTTGIGTIQVTIPTGSLTGVLPVRTRFFQKADPSANPLPLQGATYESVEPVLLTGDASPVTVSVPVRATSSGPAPNIRIETTGATPAWVTLDPTYNPTLTVHSCYCAGGSGVPSDAHVRLAAYAQPMGIDGPTVGAVVAGALIASGVRHLAVIADPSPGSIATCLLLADESWAWSRRWANSVLQSLYDLEIAGFGCAVTAYPVDNTFIRVAPTVQLTDWRYLTDTTDITVAITNAVKAYFDDRPDWNYWSLAGLRAAITSAHQKILTCSSVAVTDRNNVPLTGSSPTVGFQATHYYLLNDGILPTYQAPA